MDFIDISLFIAYALTALAALAAIIFPAIHIANDPKQFVKTGAGIGSLVLIFVISWALAGAEVTEVYTKFNVGESTSKFIGGCLITMYVSLFVAVGGILYTEIVKAIK